MLIFLTFSSLYLIICKRRWFHSFRGFHHNFAGFIFCKYFILRYKGNNRFDEIFIFKLLYKLKILYLCSSRSFVRVFVQQALKQLINLGHLIISISLKLEIFNSLFIFLHCLSILKKQFSINHIIKNSS